MKNFLRALYNEVKSWCYPKFRFGYIGTNVQLFYPIRISNPKNAFLFENSKLGYGAIILNTNAKFVLKKYSGCAEHLTVITGNHTRPIGRFYRTVTEVEKPKGFDKDVIINEDCWIGANVTLLPGVEIGRGTTIAAGAVVSKSLPPYCIAGGIPAKVLKFNFTIDEILEHEKSLYPEHERYSREKLEAIRAQYTIS